MKNAKVIKKWILVSIVSLLSSSAAMADVVLAKMVAGEVGVTSSRSFGNACLSVVNFVDPRDQKRKNVAILEFVVHQCLAHLHSSGEVFELNLLSLQRVSEQTLSEMQKILVEFDLTPRSQIGDFFQIVHPEILRGERDRVTSRRPGLGSRGSSCGLTDEVFEPGSWKRSGKKVQLVLDEPGALAGLSRMQRLQLVAAAKVYARAAGDVVALNSPKQALAYLARQAPDGEIEFAPYRVRGRTYDLVWHSPGGNVFGLVFDQAKKDPKAMIVDGDLVCM